MIERMEESARAIDLEDVLECESAIGVRLPDEYRSFLLRYNGGRPTPNAYPIYGLENNPFGAVHFFFGIDDPVESCNIDWNYEVHNGRLPANLLAIGCDGAGDLICISLYGDDAGAVVFWDRHKEPPEPSYANVYYIADSFSEFINGIRELPSHPQV